MFKYYFSLGISILFNCSSLILLKKGMLSEASFAEQVTSMAAWIKLMTNINILAAVVLFGLSFVTWMYALIKIDLSLAYPTVSLSYAIIAVISYFLFNEAITIYKGMGIAIIMIGIAIMYYR